MKKEEANNLLREASYVFARTMPENPHWYTHRKRWFDKQAFEDLVQFIRDNGIRERWHNKTFIYYYLDGYKYWTMGSPLHKTLLINKAKA